MKVDSYFTTEPFRVWKLAALSFGVLVLWYGMQIDQPAPADYTWGTIIAMSLSTHWLAPWSTDVFLRLRWKMMPLALLAAWAAVDGAWMLAIDGSPEAWDLRAIQAPASGCMFAIYGIALRPKVSLLDKIRATSAALGFRGQA